MTNTRLEPVSQEDLQHLRQLDLARQQIAESMLRLEEEKIRLMAASKRNRDTFLGTFSRLASERGLPADAVFDIDPKSGQIILPQAAEPDTAEAAEPASEG